MRGYIFVGILAQAESVLPFLRPNILHEYLEIFNNRRYLCCNKRRRITRSLGKNSQNDGGADTVTVCDAFRQKSYMPVAYMLIATFLTDFTDLPHCAVTTWP